MPVCQFFSDNQQAISGCGLGYGLILIQGLTLRFQARGPKRSFDKDKSSGQKQDFCINIYTISG